MKNVFSGILPIPHLRGGPYEGAFIFSQGSRDLKHAFEAPQRNLPDG